MRKTAARQEPEDTDPTRTRLLKTAGDQFLRDGYFNVSVRDLAATCGLTTGAIYNRFKNKAEMLVAAIEERMEADLDRSGTADEQSINLAATKRGEFERILLEICEQYPQRAALRALLIEGAAAARRDKEVRESLRTEQQEHVKRWIEIYRSWQQGQGVDASVDMEAVVLYTWAAEVGLGVLEAYGIRPPKPTAWRKVVERLVRSLKR